MVHMMTKRLQYPLTKRKVFICGCQRSGTTLVQKILNLHSDVSIMYETHIYPIANRLRFPIKRSLALLLVKKYFPFFNTQWTREKKEFEDLIKSLAQSCEESFYSPSHLLYFLIHASSKESDIVVGEKTPSHIYYLGSILKDSTASAIVVYRDPRASAASEKTKKKTWYNKDFSLLLFILRWLSSQYLAERYKRKFGNNRVMLLRFEDLITSPKKTVKRICSFVNLDYQEEMMDIDIVNSSFKKTESTKGFDDKVNTKWRSILSKREVSSIEKWCAFLMDKYAYEKEYEIKCTWLLNFLVRLHNRILFLLPELYYDFFTNIKRIRRFR